MLHSYKFVRDGILGLMVADAVGVPAEFKWRSALKKNPVTDMTEFGTHFQPKGTWSDDSSMTLCTIDSLCHGWNLEDMMNRFCDWLFRDAYTPWGNVFDVGISTRKALNHYLDEKPLMECGGRDERSNGNGSLMRILPVVFYQYIKCDQFEYPNRVELLTPVHEVSALTHAHPISMAGCGIYAQLIAGLLSCKMKNADLKTLKNEWEKNLEQAWADYSHLDTLYGIGSVNFLSALKKYERLRRLHQFVNLPEEEIKSSGYIVDTLEAAIWCFLNTDDYRDCVLKAVNLGDDTDTVAAVAGSFAGIFYGTEGIPSDWIGSLARLDWIEELLTNFTNKLKKLEK